MAFRFEGGVEENLRVSERERERERERDRDKDEESILRVFTVED